MVEYLLVITAITQIYILFILGFPVYCKVLTHVAFKKNREWVKNNPDFTAPKTIKQIAIWISYAIGIGAAAAVIQYVVINPTPDYYFELTYFPMVLSSIEFGIFLLALHHFVVKKIPAPERTKATLTPRNLGTYVPLWIVYFGGSIIAAALIIYATSYAFEIIDPELAIRRLIGILIASSIFSWAFYYALKRKHTDLEEIIGQDGRKYEVWINVALIYFAVFIVIWRVLEDFFGIYFVDLYIFMLICNISMQVFMLYYSFHPKVREILQINNKTTQKRSSLITRSGG